MSDNGPDGLPGILALSVDSFGWPEVESTASLVKWRGEADLLSLNYFPKVPDVARPVGDDRALGDDLRAGELEGGYALVEAAWEQAPVGRPVARIVLKARQEGSGMTYVGSLIIPFAPCSWVVKLQCFEVGRTGLRDAIWLDRHMANGGTLAEAGIQPSTPGAPLPPVRRMPADDPEWDDLVPHHPLSRLRRGLPRLLASIRLSPEADRLAPFA